MEELIEKTKDHHHARISKLEGKLQFAIANKNKNVEMSLTGMISKEKMLLKSVEELKKLSNEEQSLLLELLSRGYTFCCMSYEKNCLSVQKKFGYKSVRVDFNQDRLHVHIDPGAGEQFQKFYEELTYVCNVNTVICKVEAARSVIERYEKRASDQEFDNKCRQEIYESF